MSIYTCQPALLNIALHDHADPLVIALYPQLYSVFRSCRTPQGSRDF